MKVKKIMAGVLSAVMMCVSMVHFSEKPQKADMSLGVSAADSVIELWANGKDIKDSSGKLTYYRTNKSEHVANYSGGKWTAAVTTSETDTVENFIKLFDQNLKMSKEENDKVKNIAKASISNGNLTITAGTKGGSVNIWIYEVKDRQIVNSVEKSIKPEFKKVNVRVAPASPAIAYTTSFDEKGKLKKGEKVLTTVNIPYKEGSSATQDATTVRIGDRLTENVDAGTEFKAEVSPSGILEDITIKSDKTIDIKPKKSGKAKITISNTQTGKKLTLTVNAIKAYKVTFPTDAGIEVKDKDGKEYKSGDYACNGTKLIITVPDKVITINEKDTNAPKKVINYIVKDADVVLTSK